ncbi:probable tubulin polyglutamylase TTLL2 isoform X2 [Atheta coriaria]
MKKIYGNIYDFSPHGYNLPVEYTKLAAECNKPRTMNAKDQSEGYFDANPIWICKPVAQSQGRGIFLFRNLSELNYDTNTIVQKYIERPLLIGGYKFDLRLYVCIPSYHPLTIYMYREGLARFGTDKFTLNDLRNPFRHLTNSSINKLGPGYAEMKDRVGSGCKWTLKQLRRYFRQAGISDWLLWQKISVLVVLTVLSQVPQVPPTSNCFEFFGFDVLIDHLLKPWLLEVNLSPALGNDCDADQSVKKPMLHDLFDLLGLPLYNTGLSVFSIWNEDFKENNRELCANKNATLSVMNAAGRWRKKQRQKSARPKSSSRYKPKSPSKPKIRKQKSENKDSSHWGNGKDWTIGPKREGGWIKLCPFNERTQFYSYLEKGSAKQIVCQLTKWMRSAKEIAKTHPHASECQLNEFLAKDVELMGEVWIPPI